MTSRGKFLFSAGADYTIKVWDISDIKNSRGCIQTLLGHRDDVSTTYLLTSIEHYGHESCYF